MKKILLLFAAPAILCSCEGWLDVTPKSETRQEYLFRNEAGFRAALLGVYIDLGEQSLYGGNLTLGFNDVLAQYYTVPTGNPFHETAQYDFGSTAVEGTIAAVWESAYNAVANLNNLLGQLEKKGPGFFSDGRYHGILKGEATALRAMLHFDLLRLVAPSPSSDASAPAIPFVDRIGKTPFESLTVKGVTDRCLEELQEACDLLDEVDPASPRYSAGFAGADTPSGPGAGQSAYIVDGGFFLDRGLRMNWMAVRALMARVALYAGDRTRAAQYAAECLETGMFTAGDNLFSLDIDILHNYVELYFNPTGTSILTGLVMTPANRAYFYETSVYNSETRTTDWFMPADGGFVMSRFGRRQSDEAHPRLMPMIGASEVYLIYAECAGSEQERYRAVNDERRAFNIMGSDELTPGKNPDLEAEIAREYRKRFIGEGQFFYYMKRTGMTAVTRANNEVIRIAPERVYTMLDHLPADEYDYGNIKQQ